MLQIPVMVTWGKVTAGGDADSEAGATFQAFQKYGGEMFTESEVGWLQLSCSDTLQKVTARLGLLTSN